MQFKNGYKVLYEVREEAINSLYASKILQRVQQKKCVAINAETGEEVDLKPFKLVYEDGKVFYGSLTNIPTEQDVKFTFKDVDGDMVLGDGCEGPVVPKYEVTITDVENCVVTGAGKYAEGANVTITIAPIDGYVFSANNRPQIDGVDMTEENGKFTYTFVMGVEAKEITIAGVAVEEKAVAHEILYTLKQDKNAKIDKTWWFVDTKTQEGTVTIDPKRDDGNNGSIDTFFFIAINKEMHPTGAAQIQDTLGNNTTDQYDVTEEEYAGVTYIRYNYPEGLTDGAPTKIVLVKNN